MKNGQSPMANGRNRARADLQKKICKSATLRNGELAAHRIEEHQRFVAMHALNWSRSYGVDFDDLMQEGRMAVARASAPDDA